MLHDPIKNLQDAARAAAKHVDPENRVKSIALFDVTGAELLRITVPAGAVEEPAKATPASGKVAPGWDVDDQQARYDGRTIAIAASRLKLLRALVEGEGALSAKELAKLAFEKHADEENARYHLKALRKELAVAFPEFEGEIIPNDGSGYRLSLR